MIDPVVQRITNKDGSIDAKQMIQELISARDRIRDLEAALREVQRQYKTHCEVFLGEEIQEQIDALLTPSETKASPAIDPSHSDLAPDTYFPDGKPRLDSETKGDGNG